MAEYRATIVWERQGAAFTDNRYSREHRWEFDGGVQVPASASPHVVPLPYSVAAAVDPEEAFTAALSSCHMLWFLSAVTFAGVKRPGEADIAALHHEAHAECFIANSVKTDVRCEPAATA